MKNSSKLMMFFAALVMCIGIASAAAFASEQTIIKVGSTAEFDNAVTTVNAATSG